jgi:opacity protein-like surface antigen
MKYPKIISVLFFISLPIFAQISLGLKISGGSALPSGPSEFKDNWKMGYNVGFGLSVRFLGIIAFEGELDYNKFSFDDSKLIEKFGSVYNVSSVSGGSVTIITYMINLRYYLLPSISPINVYAFGGAGSSKFKVEDIQVSVQGIKQFMPGESTNQGAIQTGAGIQLDIGLLKIFVEGKYVIIYTAEKTSFFPLKAGINLGI